MSSFENSQAFGTPVAITDGTNVLIGHNLEKLKSEVQRILAGEGRSERIAQIIVQSNEKV
jgi:hypothetical protein